MYSLKLAWKQFNVDLAAMEAWVKALEPSCKGNSAGDELTFWFDSDIHAIPMHDVTTTTEVTTSVPVVDDEGNPVLDEDGNQEMEDVVSEQEETHQEPSGEPSVAQKIQAKWDALSAESAEAVSYIQKAQAAAVKAQVLKINAFSADLLAQFAAENIAMGITADNMTEEVLDVMLPVMSALQGGAPTVAIKRAKQIPESSYDAKYVTEARLLAYVNKIEAFLGLPASSSL